MTKHSNRCPKIYAIKFRGKVIYIGQTTMSVDARFWEHLNRAENGRRGVPKLYSHMCKNSFRNYTFELLEIPEPGKEEEREIFWISKMRTRDTGCNTTPGGKVARGKDHYMWGRAAHPQAIAASVAWRKGKPLPQEWRDAISRGNKGKPRNNQRVVCETTGEEFHSIRDAAKHFGVSMFTMQRIVQGLSEQKSRRKLKDLSFRLMTTG